MIIPYQDKKARDEKVFAVRDTCLNSRSERVMLYDLRRRFFLWGTDNNTTEQVKYNRLQAHLDLVASFLYAADHAKYSLSVGQTNDEALIAQAIAMQDNWNDQFRDSGLAYMAGDAILWSLINDTSIIKLGWNDERGRLGGRMIDATSFGVFDESEPDLDAQEAFTHLYRLPWDNAVLRLVRAGLRDQIKKLGTKTGLDTSDYPPLFQAMMISSTGGSNITGNVAGMAPASFTPVPTYEAKRDVTGVEFQEVWIWDDLREDYAIFTIADPDILLSDSRETIAALGRAANNTKVSNYSSTSNIYLPQEHPFVPFTPFTLPNYIWGQAHCDRLIPLQRWTNERLDQISEILELQVDPAKVASGFMGLQDEKLAALGGPGTWVMDSLPQAKVEQLKPEMPEDIFAEFKEIGHVFLEASGLTETVLGKGEQGVRGRGHARQLATTGSSRIKKIAVALEQPLVKLGDLGIKLIQRNSEEKLLARKVNQEFLPAQFSAKHWNLRIAGHSHSPLFADESRELAVVLLKARAIDREMFIRLLNPPDADNMIHRLREIIAGEAKAAQARMAAGGQPGGGTRQPRAA